MNELDQIKEEKVNVELRKNVIEGYFYQDRSGSEVLNPSQGKKSEVRRVSQK